MPRKTIDVQTVIDFTNHMLANSRPHMDAERKGAIHLLERVLHETGNYNGFQYLWNHEAFTAAGQSILSNPMENLERGKFEINAETRRRYYSTKAAVKAS